MKNKKNMYLLFLFIICLLSIVIVPTYAKFSSNYTTENDIVALTLNYDLKLTGVEEYEEIIVPAGKVEVFNVKITNGTNSKLYYGIWYQLINNGSSSEGMRVGRMSGSTTSTSGVLDDNDSTIVSIVAINDSTTDNMKLNIGVARSDTSVSDIEYLNDRELITGDLFPYDLIISSIKVNGTVSNTLPTSGLYEMNYSCEKGTVLTWDTYNKNIIYDGSKSVLRDNCSLEFTASTDYPLLSEMPVGSYVAYVGDGGVVAGKNVSCQKNGSLSSSDEAVETEASNSCYGQNAREDLDDSEYTYGYCGSKNNKYHVTGWRIAYVLNKGVHLISAGSPECVMSSIDSGNVSTPKILNARAIKYCNSKFVDGSCECSSSVLGQCDSASSVAAGVWALDDTSFFRITNYISGGYGKRVADKVSELGIVGPTLDVSYCSGKKGYMECGYNNSLLDNGGNYFFASSYDTFSKSTILWDANVRGVDFKTEDVLSGLRPIIRLKSSVYVTGGSGTMEDPYTIGIN